MNPQPQNSAPSGPKFKNPYFEDVPKNYFRKIKLYLIIILSGLVLLFIILIPTFFRKASNNITLATYRGNNRITENELLEQTNKYLSGNFFGIIPKKNVYFVPTEGLKNHLENYFQLESINIQKSTIRKTLSIDLKEKPLQFITRIENIDYYLAHDGTILEPIPQEASPAEGEEARFFLTIELIDQKIQSGDSRLSALATELVALAEYIEKNGFYNDWRFIRITLNNMDATDVKLFTDKGWYAYIDRSQEIEQQVQLVKNVYDQQNENVTIREYIDVRLNDRVFVK